MLNRIIQFLFLSFFSLTLIACATPEPQVFGVPQSEWNQLSKDQQDQVIRAYNERQQTKEVNKPMSDFIDAAKDVIDQENTPKAKPTSSH